ncbi:MAG TPA: type II toxin-antitoxin system mRNA interferase toxin, RelE/StbE family [Candidatus Saccharimonadales bacterium]|nr:type II toxin-antitoxin system mRNA interferase toxin, RelE/StbE family [Candidatus Saccharimonadales bacterium]
MKRIELHRSFIKNFAKRIAKDEKLGMQYEKRVDMFIGGHRDAPLYDHSLTGDMLGRRAFWITGDIRVIYIELEDKILFIDVGSHNQVY